MATRVWVGFAQGIEGRQLIARYIDPLAGQSDYESVWASIDSHGESDAEDILNSIGELERSFGAAPNAPGSYEVYNRAGSDSGTLDVAAFLTCAPFDVALPGLAATNPADIDAAFYVVQDAEPSRYADGTVTITDVVNVVFEWAQ